MRPARLNAQVIAALQLRALSADDEGQRQVFMADLDGLLKDLSDYTVRQLLREAYGLDEEEEVEPHQVFQNPAMEQVAVERVGFHQISFQPGKNETEADATPLETRALFPLIFSALTKEAHEKDHARIQQGTQRALHWGTAAFGNMAASHLWDPHLHLRDGAVAWPARRYVKRLVTFAYNALDGEATSQSGGAHLDPNSCQGECQTGCQKVCQNRNDVLDGAQRILSNHQVGCVFVCTYGLENSSNNAIWRLRLLGYAAAGSVWNEDGHGFEWVKACPVPWA
eukprot:s382_g3.t1